MTVRITRESAVISVADNGLGFPFSGRYDLAALRADRLGPRSLMDRVTALGGELVITTSRSGSRVEISIPLRPPAAWGKAPFSSNVSDQSA